jgi:hypothetical protein
MTSIACCNRNKRPARAQPSARFATVVHVDTCTPKKMADSRLHRSPRPGGLPPPFSSSETPPSAPNADSQMTGLICRWSPSLLPAKNGTWDKLTPLLGIATAGLFACNKGFADTSLHVCIRLLCQAYC